MAKSARKAKAGAKRPRGAKRGGSAGAPVGARASGERGEGKSKGVGAGKGVVVTPARQSARAPEVTGALLPRQVQAYREVFWQNVLREVLVSLVSMSAASDVAREGGSRGAPGEGEQARPEPSAGLDGRLGLITTQGQRIPIARVFPVFAASMATSRREVTLASLLQCTVFQVHTPRGEVYTLPLQEVRGFHALTEELMEELADAARGESAKDGAGEAEPFGFAAFTSIARGKLPADVEGDAPDDGLGEGWSDASAI
jgi:hypothetical protein